MKERQYLKKSVTLCGESDGAAFKRTFVIVKKISEGTSSVCYEAYHGNSGRGVLKEFYPQNAAYAMERTAQGQLIHSQESRDAYECFLKAEKEYVEPYEMLLYAKQNSTDQDLSTFIPAFEIYHGCDDNGNIVGTTYIWTQEPKLETFDKVCDEIHKRPEHNPEHKLVTVLSAMESLVKCIRALHNADMIHRDINPSNFGFIKRGNETLTQTLSMFDIDSVCSVYGKNDGIVGTDGYIEPEAGSEAANYQTDIYSIGATLFQAIIVTDEVKADGCLYNSKYYDRIHELVDESRLIRASEANSHPRLRNIIAEILKKCLCERTYRYADCGELLNDLETALYYSLPSDIAGKSRSGEKWVLADVESYLDVNKEKNSFLAIQYHLYEHPLYQCSSAEEDTINVLVIGFGNYGQKFLDVCLQNGQLRNKKLNVTVVSDDLTDKKIYMSERPELADFFNVDSSLEENEDSYGDIAFEITKLERCNQAANSNILQNIICDHYDGKRPHYIFIALGDDSLNLAAANACITAINVFEMNCIVSYVCENRSAHKITDPHLCPLYVNQDIKKSAIYCEIERMAFNTHLVWEKNLNVDYETIRANFRKMYNHDSCVSSVIALKYKLYSIGINLNTTGFSEAAHQFQEIIADKSNPEIKNELIWVEHRRWITEKLCLGWRRIKNLEECADGVTKDEKNKKHVCIVRSRPDQKLDTEYKTNDNYDKWNKASNNDLDQLDELDRMSVELHRMFVRRAKEARNQNLLYGNNMAGIRGLIEGNRKTAAAFQEWFTCLKDIWNGDKEKVRLYKGLRDSFLNAADTLSDKLRQSIRDTVKIFEAVFYPILASMEYRSWKQDDAAFVDNIPFVLTYTENAYMVIPFVTGENTDVFGNVAAPAVVNPDRIIYLYLIEKKQDIKELQDPIPYVVEYMRKKHFRASVEFVLAYTETAAASFVNKKVEKEIIGLGGGRIRQVKCIALNGVDTISEEIGSYLKKRCVGKRFFAVEKNTARLSYMLQGAGLYNAFASYKFDSKYMKFNAIVNCDMLRHIKKTPYITVTDMAAFRLSSSESSNHPEFFDDYKELWKKYSENSFIWKQLCGILGEYSEKNDTIALFKQKNQSEKEKKAKEYHHYIIPFACCKSVDKIVRFLKKHGVMEQGSCVYGYTTDSCEVVIIDRCGYRAEYDKLFSNVYALMLPDAITLHLNTKRKEINVVFDNLVVKEIQIGGSRLKGLMYYFKEKGYVINLTVSSDDKMSFTYASRQIKELLTTAGKMLEVYTYHKVKELGEFDDVVSSFEIEWEDTEVKSEFDCILTKGFRTLFVECKARPNIDQNYYYKLESLAKQFGINATAVLIADTQEKGASPDNDMQRKRGNMLDLVTIWKSDEINNIGHTLLKVINGSYVDKEK